MPCAGTTPFSSWPDLTRPATSCFFSCAQKRRGCPGHLGAKTRVCPGMTGSCLRGYSLQGCSKIEKPLMPADASAWSLHSQLKKDTIDIGDLPLCKVLVIKDAHYPWLLLVPRREGAVEIIDLDEVAQAQLMTKISRVSRALKEITG